MKFKQSFFLLLALTTPVFSEASDDSKFLNEELNRLSKMQNENQKEDNALHDRAKTFADENNTVIQNDKRDTKPSQIKSQKLVSPSFL
jgi:hypothetical protein